MDTKYGLQTEIEELIVKDELITLIDTSNYKLASYTTIVACV